MPTLIRLRIAFTLVFRKRVLIVTDIMSKIVTLSFKSKSDVCYAYQGMILSTGRSFSWGAFDSAKNHKRQRRKRQSVTAKRAKLQTPKFVWVRSS